MWLFLPTVPRTPWGDVSSAHWEYPLVTLGWRLVPSQHARGICPSWGHRGCVPTALRRLGAGEGAAAGEASWPEQSLFSPGRRQDPAFTEQGILSQVPAPSVGPTRGAEQPGVLGWGLSSVGAAPLGCQHPVPCRSSGTPGQGGSAGGSPREDVRGKGRTPRAQFPSRGTEPCGSQCCPLPVAGEGVPGPLCHPPCSAHRGPGSLPHATGGCAPHPRRDVVPLPNNCRAQYSPVVGR